MGGRFWGGDAAPASRSDVDQGRIAPPIIATLLLIGLEGCQSLFEGTTPADCGLLFLKVGARRT